MGAWQYCGERNDLQQQNQQYPCVDQWCVTSEDWSPGVCSLDSFYLRLHYNPSQISQTQTQKTFFFWACHHLKKVSFSKSPQIVVSVTVIGVLEIAPFFIKKVKICVTFSDDENKSKGVMQVSDDWFTYWRRRWKIEDASNFTGDEI